MSEIICLHCGGEIDKDDLFEPDEPYHFFESSCIAYLRSRASLLEGIVRELVEEGDKLHKQVTVDGWTYKEWPEVVAKAKEAVK